MRRICLAVVLSMPFIAAGTHAAFALAEETTKRAPAEKAGNVAIAAYAITLDVSGSPELRPWKPLPPALKDRRLYIARRTDGIRKRYLLNLGFFARRTAADAARKLLLADYPSAVVIGVTREEERESAKTAIGAPPSPVATTVTRSSSASVSS